MMHDEGSYFPKDDGRKYDWRLEAEMEKFITTAFSFEGALECVINGHFPACPWF